jgi:hypothetical protein
MATTPIFKSADPLFNTDAAVAAYELVMKMDEDTARVFTEIVVADVVEEIIEKNLRSVQAHLDKVVAKRIEMVKKTVIAKSLGNPDAVPFAQALALVEKSAKNPYQYGYVWNEKDFNRDLTTGRFRSKVSHTQKKPISDNMQDVLGIPQHPRHDKLKPAQKAKFQDEYRQLAAFLSSVHESTRTPGDTKVALHFEDKAGNRSVRTIEGTHVGPEMLEPDGADLVGIEAKPGALTVGGASFGLTHALGRRGVESVNAGAEGFPGFADTWTQAADPKNSNQRTYARIGAGSKLLGEIAPHSPHAQMAAAFGSFVGSMGPEAEKVIGPSARKTAYRYRGTEKTPDKGLVGGYAAGIRHAKAQSSNDPYRNTPEGKRANLKAPQDLAPSQMARARQKDEGRTPTWEERDTGRAVIQTYLRNKIPDRGLYGLQLASGNTPPSQGVLLNKDGQIVSEAVGYGDDHYLPFDLKNLKALKGGEYIRTRSVGGLTSEDIYTGLVMGARQVQVVSRSGTFTLTFEEDLKGGRRHNDKARRMTRRYEQILDAVQSEQVDKPGNIRDDVKQLLMAEVEKELGGYDFPAREKRALLNRKIEEYKSSSELTATDELLIEELARRKRADGVSPDAKDYVRQVTAEVLADKHQRYRLDGHGYQEALKALEEQFPYYIKVNSKIEDEQDVSSINLDRGYVEPDRNRPTAAQAGLFGTSANPGMKFSASQADYQGATSTGARSGSTPGSAGAPAATSGAQGSVKFDASKFKILPKPENKVSGDFVPAALAIKEVISDEIDVKTMNVDQREAMSYTAEDLRDPGKQAKFDRMVQAASQSVTLPDKPLTEYNAAKGQFGLKPYSEAMRGVWTNLPFAFAGPAFEGKNLEAKRAELARIDEAVPSSILSPRKLSTLSSAELYREHEALTRVFTRLDAAGNPADAAVRAQILIEMGADKSAPGLKLLLQNPDKAGDYLDAVHRTRAVIQGMTDEERKPTQTMYTGTGSPDEGAKAGAQKMVTGLMEAAELTLAHDPEKASKFLDLASEIRQNENAILHRGNVEALIDANREVLAEVGDILARRTSGHA